MNHYYKYCTPRASILLKEEKMAVCKQYEEVAQRLFKDKVKERVNTIITLEAEVDAMTKKAQDIHTSKLDYYDKVCATDETKQINQNYLYCELAKFEYQFSEKDGYYDTSLKQWAK
eukprot:1109682_1